MSISNNGSPGASLPNMQNLAEDSMFYRFCDIELLRTGSHSDALVTAGTQEWKVHKNIVCTRSRLMADDEEVHNIRDYTEKQVDLILEFIYSGCIAAIADFSLADCVELSILGKVFDVDGMTKYAKKALWDKLTAILRAVSTIPFILNQQTRDAIEAKLNELNFHKQFTDAVDKAYGGHNADATQVVLADFVWVAQAWLHRHPMIEDLNVRHPKFGSHVLSTWNNGGPKSFVVQADGQLTPAASHTVRVLDPDYSGSS